MIWPIMATQEQAHMWSIRLSSFPKLDSSKIDIYRLSDVQISVPVQIFKSIHIHISAL